MVEQFINDMIHMTEGEKLVHYWPLWLAIVLLVTIVCVWIALSKNRRKE